MCNQHLKCFNKQASIIPTITITFGDAAENHKGMEILGERSDEGFTLKDLQEAKERFSEENYEAQIYHLNEVLNDINYKEYSKNEAERNLLRLKVEEADDAYILIVRNGVNAILEREGMTIEEMKDDLLKEDWDKKAIFDGKVLNKRARHNLCFADNDQEPDYENGKGRIISFGSLKSLNTIRELLPEYIGEKAGQLLAEGNLYYDPSKCGIGFHGDSERKKVVAVRIGQTMCLQYKWHLGAKQVSNVINFELNNGDLYVMSEKAVGYDWKRRKVLTLRHAAGCSKYTINV